MRNLSFGLQLILIMTLIGSCAGGGQTTYTRTESGGNSSDLFSLRNDVTRLQREVHKLRRDLKLR